MTEEKLDIIISDLELIKKTLKIVPDRDDTITDFDGSISAYEEFAIGELGLSQGTIKNQKSAIRRFLEHSNGIINKEMVKSYLDSNEQSSWKSNQLKALRKYVRDYLKLGNWITEFSFTKEKPKLKSELPTDEQVAHFCSVLSYQVQMIFLILYNSGLRIGEVLELRESNISFELNMIDASQIHTGETKSSWISFVTKQTAEYLEHYLYSDEIDPTQDDPKLFTISYKTVQNEFKQASEMTGININPHLLRTVFTEKCREAVIDKEYINAFCGRAPKGMLESNYTVYSPKSLRKQYDKAEPHLYLKYLS